MNSKILLVLIFLFSCPPAGWAQRRELEKVSESNRFGCEEIKIHSFNLLEKMKLSPDWKAYIMIYIGADERDVYDDEGDRSVKLILPRRGEADARARAVRVMLRFLKAPSQRIKIIDGGFRDRSSVEFWLARDGAASPKPNPTIKSMKYRKGKAPRIDYWDC